MKTTTMWGRGAAVAAAGLLAVACFTKGCSKTDGAATSERPAEVTKGAPATSVAPAVPSVALTTTAPAPSASGSVPSPAVAAKPAASGAASAKPGAAASGSAAPTAGVAAKAPPATPARAKVDGTNFAIDVSTPGCRADEECAVTLRLTATGDYHVNKEYPYKFVGQAASTHAFLGKDDPNTFSKQSGDFREEGEKVATMTVRLKPKSSGEAKVSGTYKLSVCSADKCQIDAPKIELAIPVL